jgi:cobalt-zinc-cadmium efflux system outer membrane protein
MSSPSFVRRAVPSFLVLVLFAPPARGQDAFPLAADSSVRALLEETLAHNPDVLVARERAAAATARIAPAGALADPTVSFGYDKGDAWLPGDGADTGPRIGFSQELPFSGKRQLRRDLNAREADLSRHAISAVTFSITYALRKAIADLLLARENLAIIQDQRRATSDIEELTRARYSAGLGSQLDVLRAQAEVARFDQMRLHEEGQAASAVAEINRLRGQPEGTAVEIPGGLKDLSGREIVVPPLSIFITHAEEASPELGAALTLIEKNRLAIDLAQKGFKPDFVVSTSYGFRGSLPDRWTADVSINLPLYRRSKQRQAVVEAEAGLREAQASQQAMKLKARAAVEKAYADFQAAVLEARTIERQVLVIDALAVESALAGFRSGQTPFISVLEAHRVLYEDRRQYAELLFHILWHGALLDAFGMERQTS